MCPPQSALLDIYERDDRRRKEANSHQAIMARHGIHSDKWYAHIKQHRENIAVQEANGVRDDMRITGKWEK